MLHTEPFRIEPNMPVTAYQTYQVESPRDLSVRVACEQVECSAYRHGWESIIDERTELGANQAIYIRRYSRRTFTERHTDAGLTIFRFEAGQRCFANHRTRPETYTVWPGDWRQRIGPVRKHSRPADWVEDFGEHQQRISDQQQKG